MDPKQRDWLALGIIAILVAASWFLFWPPSEKITQGLDIQGGLSVILTAEETTNTAVTADTMDRALRIVENRVNALGASEASVQRQGQDAILIQLPGIKNADEALRVLGSTGQLEFVAVESITDSATLAALTGAEPGERVQLPEGSYTAFMTGAVITDASIDTDPNTGEIAVNVDMSEEGRQTWAEFTTASVGNQVAIVLDGIVQSAPVVREPITQGRTQISGSFTPEEAKNLKTVLETGALPVSLTFSESRVVGPTLGAESLRQGVLAALVGMALVALYVLVFYRGLGLVTWGALFVFASLFLGVLALLSQFGVFALSLPGIAGIVLTIGLAADSSILILERFKEEIRMGKTYRSAATSGTRHAIGTSIDADLVTLVSAAVIFFIAIGPVKGFALTLMIGIFCDIVTMILFTRSAVELLGQSTVGKVPAFFGVSKERLAVPEGASKKGDGSRG